MRISDWSSDVCSSDLAGKGEAKIGFIAFNWRGMKISRLPEKLRCGRCRETGHRDCCQGQIPGHPVDVHNCPSGHYCHYSSASESTSSSVLRSEEHTSELQSLMRNSYAVFCLQKKHILT